MEKKKYGLAELKVEVRTQILNLGREIENEEVFIRADADVPYGAVMEVMAEIRKAGVKKLGLITEPPSSDKS